MNMKARKGWMTRLCDKLGMFPKPKKTRSAESKAKQSEGMKKAWARKKARKEEAVRLNAELFKMEAE